MTRLTGHYDTPNASKYLQQLCKHFGHKLPVSFSPEAGQITFPFGAVELAADDTRLTAQIALEDAGDLDRAKQVIDKHLERFAFREGFTRMEWALPGA